jgi:CDP-diacylglycerol--serine O-phosphatidyltransferase
VVPALFTLGNMALGFYSMVRSAAGEYNAAATAILVGHVLDMLDGRVARWTRTSSRFGVELDSFADLVTFCVSPAFLMYELVLKNNRVWGFPMALLFVICGTLRLAKFNLKAQMGEEGKSTYFSGLPTPAAGGMLAIFALLYDVLELGRPIRSMKVVMYQIPYFYEFVPAIMFVLSMLMVSEVRYSTFKTVNLLRPRSMRALILTLMVLMMIYVYPQNTIFIFYVAYIVWGVVDALFLKRLRARMAPRPRTEGYQHDNYGK